MNTTSTTKATKTTLITFTFDELIDLLVGWGQVPAVEYSVETNDHEGTITLVNTSIVRDDK